MIVDTLGPEDQFLSTGNSSVSRKKTVDIRNHDTGDRHPSDVNFIAKTIGNVNRSGEVISTPNPINSPIQAPVQTPYPGVKTIPLVGDGLVLDLSKTKVRDSINASEEAIAYLSDLLHFDTNNNRLCLKSDIWIWSDAHPDKEFDFQFDEAGDIWGAGTAWLKSS
jgi:hypothetical protein